MKRLFSAIFILLLVIALCFFSVVSLGRAKSVITAHLSQMEAILKESPSQSQIEKIKAKAIELEKSWEKLEAPLYFTINLDEISEIDKKISSLSYIAKFEENSLREDNITEIISLVGEIKELISSTYQNELPSIRNVF